MNKFAIGDRVKHAEYGRGTVVQVRSHHLKVEPDDKTNRVIFWLMKSCKKLVPKSKNYIWVNEYKNALIQGMYFLSYNNAVNEGMLHGSYYIRTKKFVEVKND